MYARSCCRLYLCSGCKQVAMEEFGMDAQIGFRPDRGTIDGICTAFVGLRKRKVHGLETWSRLIDLVNGFDTVPRVALFAILCRFGLPDHSVNIVIRLRGRALINIKWARTTLKW